MKIDLSKLSDQTMRRILADILSADEPESVAAVRNAAPVSEPEDESADTPKRKRKRRIKAGSHTRYVIQHRDASEDGFTPMVWECYRALLKADKRNMGKTETEWLAIMGWDELRRKALQSPIWNLRNHDAKGNRVPPDSKKAVVRAER